MATSFLNVNFICQNVLYLGFETKSSDGQQLPHVSENGHEKLKSSSFLHYFPLIPIATPFSSTPNAIIYVDKQA